MNLLKRLLKLEQLQPQTQFCFPLPFFYGEPANPEPLTIGQTLSDFYNRPKIRAQSIQTVRQSINQ